MLTKAREDLSGKKHKKMASQGPLSPVLIDVDLNEVDPSGSEAQGRAELGPSPPPSPSSKAPKTRAEDIKSSLSRNV
jgi:hypothetical protein